MEEEQEHLSEFSFLDIVITVLSVYVLIALLIDSFFKLPHEISRLLYYIDNAVCLVFLYDFINRYRKAKSKTAFMKWGWIDLISSIPAIAVLRLGRVVRLLRILRVLRAFRSFRFLTAHIFRHKMRGTFASVCLIAMLMLIASSISILEVERDPHSTIKTAEDAIWWSFDVITSANQFNKTPVTLDGRIIGALIKIVGIALIGTFTGMVTSWFIGSKQEN